MTTARFSVEVPRDYWLTANRTVTNHGYRRRIIDALHAITATSARGRWLAADDSTHVVEERFRRGPNLPQRGGHLVVAAFQPAEEASA